MIQPFAPKLLLLLDPHVMTKCYLLLFALLCSAWMMAQPTWDEIEIPMSDGNTLAADLYTPEGEGPWPVIFIQTPYNKNLFHLGLPIGVGWEQESSDYAFVIMDWRGFYGSLAAFSLTADRGEDGYEAVEWIAEQDWCDGNVGTWGPSALGNVQYETAREQPPHLKCCVPQVASPWTHYQQYLPGGIAKTEYLNQLNALFGAFDLVLENPEYNLLWSFTEASTMYPESIEVPMLLTGGWYDHNIADMVLMYDTLTSSSPASAEMHILIGPWVHGGTSSAFVGSSVQGELEYPGAAGYSNAIEMQFFDHHLRGLDNGWDDQPPVEYWRLNQEGWFGTDSWPPSNEIQEWWLDNTETGVLQGEPSTSVFPSTYSYDPLDPSPTIGGITLTDSLLQGPADQIPEVEGRPDCAIFTSEGAVGMMIEGTITAVLEVATSTVDSDIVCRLTDVYPDGRSMLLGEAQLRLRFREGFSADDVAWMDPGEVTQIQMDFPPIAHYVPEGHELRLIISSSNYPRLNRNMNNGGDLYPDANPDAIVDPQVADVEIHMGNSRLLIPAFVTTDIQEANAGGVQGFKAWFDQDELVINSKDAGRRWIKVFDVTGSLIHEGVMTGGIYRNLITANGACIVVVEGMGGTTLLR